MENKGKGNWVAGAGEVEKMCVDVVGIGFGVGWGRCKCSSYFIVRNKQ